MSWIQEGGTEHTHSHTHARARARTHFFSLSLSHFLSLPPSRSPSLALPLASQDELVRSGVGSWRASRASAELLTLLVAAADPQAPPRPLRQRGGGRDCASA